MHRHALPWAAALFALASIVLLHVVFVAGPRHDTLAPENEIPDIYFVFLEGQRLLGGHNPYARIHDSDMRNNDKYATYFPGAYLMSAAAQAAGLREYAAWLSAWRIVMELAYIATGLILMAVLMRRGGAVAGMMALAFWLFSRWSLAVIPIAHLDPLAVLFLAAALVLHERQRIPALLLFGCSLAIKQMAVFLIPVLLIEELRRDGQGRFAWRRASQGLALMLAIPFVLSIPFLAWDYMGFVKSMLFSATRAAAAHFVGAPSLDTLAGIQGPLARLPMAGMLALAYALLWQRRISLLLAALLAMTFFIDFNSVLFRQYMLWTTPLLILVVGERMNHAPKADDA